MKLLNKTELNEARMRAKFYATHPKETADIWSARIKEALNGVSDTTAGMAIISPQARTAHKT